MTQWFEDVEVGRPHRLGQHTFNADEIVRFARTYDPQYFHLSEQNARRGHFGGLVASGWHTALVGQRLMIDALAADDARRRGRGEEPGVAGPSPGVNRMGFSAPVRPGDTVVYTLTVSSKRPSRSLPGWGLLITNIDAVNQRGESVYHAEVASFTRLRNYRMPVRRRLALALTRLPGLRKVLRRGASA